MKPPNHSLRQTAAASRFFGVQRLTSGRRGRAGSFGGGGRCTRMSPEVLIIPDDNRILYFGRDRERYVASILGG
jgi:hypothetical protein